MKKRWLAGLAGAALLGAAILGGSASRGDGGGGGGAPSGAAPTPTPVAVTHPMVLSYYFYWYDAQSGAHLQPGSLRDTPPADPAPSWRSVAWHQRQFSDMADAGIDTALAVYWGADNPQDAWSPGGLPVMAQALDRLNAAGHATPKLGMFLDTTVVNHRDLTTDAGKQWFYRNFRDFFQAVPRQWWATVGGRPIAFLFTTDWTEAVNQATFDYVYQQFQADFGVRPYLVREVSWDYAITGWQNGERVRDYQQPIATDNSYLWAAAMHGFVDRGGVAAVGPGYNDTHVADRKGGTSTDRRNGDLYATAFRQAIAAKKPLLVIETWNEYHEGSDIAESREYGRRYLDLTKQLTAEFRAAWGQ